VTWTLLHGDCREVLATMDDGSIDAVVTDPPYELGFMGKAWDAAGVAYSGDLWAEVLRVLKPGGHLLAFGGTRTYHRMAVAIEDAGFEIRDSINWVYGSGFPKSLDVSKAIDKAAGAEREVVGMVARTGSKGGGKTVHQEGGDKNGKSYVTAPATPEAARWDGWGTALKPAHEPIVVARKPLDGTVAPNVLEYGTGALNIDGCRVGTDGGTTRGSGGGRLSAQGCFTTGHSVDVLDSGRWPANFVLTHAADCGDDCAPGCPVAALDKQSGEGASRFFTVTEWDDAPFRYVAKPSRAERNAGLGGLPEVHRVNGNKWTDQDYRVARGERPESAETGPRRNIHPTVKPLDLMRWLVRLVTPPGGVVLDPFAGSGTTLAAAILEGFDCVGVEMTDDYLPLIEGRCTWAEKAARFGPVTGRPRVDGDDTPTLFDVEDDK
jgi:site-specific DNA-methyltransferase (adenine-specific)